MYEHSGAVAGGNCSHTSWKAGSSARHSGHPSLKLKSPHSTAWLASALDSTPHTTPSCCFRKAALAWLSR